jgi:hypothetical protein
MESLGAWPSPYYFPFLVSFRQRLMSFFRRLVSVPNLSRHSESP